ncbi:hypothetical protein [Priestia koreensis]|uniref:Uncharacterized protein n=1 Tax=Priestia koreensis TaxID=284581 RepID=A0A0M0LBC7_9BACI|nr:hypothetical protein [Priestia koreensis]KOO48162.1 hypothetical protein AMD01_04975 [Priestia koreensis]
MKQKFDAFTHTTNRLEALYRHDESFRQQLDQYKGFYIAKFWDLITSEHDRNRFVERFLEAFDSQFFNGYFIATEILHHEETVMPNEWFQQPSGTIKEQIPGFIKRALGGEFDEQMKTTLSQRILSWAIQEFEDIRPIINQAYWEIVCLGAEQAFRDEMFERQVEVMEEQEIVRGALHRLDDFYFVDPQKYFAPDQKSAEMEIWSLHTWSAIEALVSKVGELMIINRRIIDADSAVNIRLYLKSTIHDNERMKIVEHVLYQLSQRLNLGQEHFMVDIAIIEDFYLLTSNAVSVTE